MDGATARRTKSWGHEWKRIPTGPQDERSASGLSTVSNARRLRHQWRRRDTDRLGLGQVTTGDRYLAGMCRIRKGMTDASRGNGADVRTPR